MSCFYSAHIFSYAFGQVTRHAQKAVDSPPVCHVYNVVATLIDNGGWKLQMDVRDLSILPRECGGVGIVMEPHGSQTRHVHRVGQSQTDNSSFYN